MRKLFATLLLLCLAASAPTVLAPLLSAAQLHRPSRRPANLFGRFVSARYMNPLPISLADGSTIESCPDPSIIRSQTPGDSDWYMYCTNDVFHDNGPLHRMAISRSADLAHWTYVTDVFPSVPSFLPGNAGLWAPDIQFFNGKYYLYYTSSTTQAGGPAIFVATSDNPAGPFTAIPTPVVPPERLSNGQWRDVIDSNIATEDGQPYLLYGSFSGGILARPLTEDGLSTVPTSETQISPSRRYEGSYVVKHQGYYYLFLSAGTCCAGAGSGYGVYVARAPHVLGPYLDKDGVSLMDSNVGGTPVLLMNGNRWLGPGHNATFTDLSGQDWMLYHAVDSAKPTLSGAWTRRPAMIDPIDWSDGWPLVRAGAGASDQPEAAPSLSNNLPQLAPTPASHESLGPVLTRYSDEFDGNRFNLRWTWLHASAKGTFALQNGALIFATQAGNMLDTQHDAPLLSTSVPSRDWVAEVKLSTNLEPTNQHNSVQSGLVLYQDDAHYLKLTMQTIDDTRQLEFARKDGPNSWGRAYLASASPEIWLRLVRHGSIYTSYSSHDGQLWTLGPSWTLHSPKPRIALISAGGRGYLTRFEYLRIGERQ